MERSEALKFGFSHQFDRTCEQALSGINSNLSAEAAAFCGNVERILHVAALPANLVHWAMLMGQAQVLACDSLSLPLTTDINKLPEPTASKLHEVIQKLIGLHRLSLEKDAEFRMQTWYGSNINLDNLIDDEAEGKLALAVEAIMQSQIISTWTAIESLMGDLWVKTLNLRPELGIRAMDAEITPDDDERTRNRKEKLKRDYPVPSWMVRQPGFDLNKNMGTLLKGKWDFSRRKEACDAYLRAFGKSEHDALRTVFESDDLRWIAATRNALVHRGGRADAEFTAIVVNHPVLSQANEGEAIPLNGELVGSLIGNANKRAVELVVFVSRWLQ